MNKYNDVEFIDQVHYDILVVDENGNRLRSYAEDIGRVDLFNGFGQVHLLLPVEENAGISLCNFCSWNVVRICNPRCYYGRICCGRY